MITASDYLAQFGVSIQEAREFIATYINNPQFLHQVFARVGITNQMVAEIADVPVEVVRTYFSSQGLDPKALEGNSGSGTPGTTTLFPEDYAPLAKLAAFNSESGELSTTSLRAKVIAKTGAAAYDKAFSPSTFAGSQDGTITAEEFGYSSLGNFAATQENFESLFYGTTIKMYKAIDMNEIMQLGDFVSNPKNQAALAQQDPAVLKQYINLIVAMFEDPANPPLYSDAALAQVLTITTQAMVTVVGQQSNANVFDGFFSGFANPG